MTALELVTTPVPEPTVGAVVVPAAAGDPGVIMRVRDVVVRYGPHVALNGVSLDLRRGEILGLLGPNGAGKSTLIRRLAGLLPSRTGTVEIDGADPGTSRAARARVGYLPEEPPLYPEETALGYVTYMAALAGVPRRERRPAALDALEQAGGAKFAGRPTGRLSKGQRQRVGFAAAIVHQPDLILLDEPTSGLDPAQMVKFRQVVRDVGRQAAVLFSTHLLPEAQAVCDRVVILDRGTVVADRPVNRRPGHHLRVRVGGADVAAVEGLLRTVPGVLSAAGDQVEVGQPDVARRIASAVLGQGWDLLELAEVPDDLEQAFLDAVAGRPQ